MTAEERQTERERQSIEMYRHITDLAEMCNDLAAARDPFSVHNAVHKMRSLVGQIESNSHRYCRLS
jgi:hypothetical protein